jgi:hypothetical protein
LKATLAEYKRGALGASATISPRADDAEAIALCQATEGVLPGDGWDRNRDGSKLSLGAWHTWRHECAAAAARDSANPHAMAMVFDWALMQQAQTREEYEVLLQAKHGRVWQ